MAVPPMRKQQPQKRKPSNHVSTMVLWLAVVVLSLVWLAIMVDLLRYPNESFVRVAVSRTSTTSRAAISFTTTNLDLSTVDEDVHRTVADYLTMGVTTSTSNVDSARETDILQRLLPQAMAQVQAELEKTLQRPSLPLTAYLEAPLPPVNNNNDDNGPRLPLRTHNTPDQLQTMVYSSILRSCDDVPSEFPVDPLPIPESVRNVPHRDNLPEHHNNNDSNEPSLPLACPSDLDPFLPWIHDAFVTTSATEMHFVAHNRRRCNTDPQDYNQTLQHMEPQVALMQSVPVKRIPVVQPQRTNQQQHRYRLASLQDADPDAKETRFICQFHVQLLLSGDNHNKALQKVIVGETLSVFPYNYEHANYQKRGSKPMLTRPDHTSNSDNKKQAVHNEQVWNSLLHFTCPIPGHLRPILQHQQKTGGSNLIPSIYVDVVPIRTYPRTTREGYFDRTSRHMQAVATADDSSGVFDPHREWGERHILPPVQASGRWANVPLCPIATSTSSTENGETTTRDNQQLITMPHQSQKHFLVGCLWASASFTTRGSSEHDTSTTDRLLEWLTYQLYMAEFDHIYIYDNSPQSTSTVDSPSLKPITDLFPSSRVTRIPWKHRVCNNHRPAHPNPGERSSQYAAEMSCRVRYGPTTKWMSVLDTDEYLIPQPPWKSIRQWLQDKYSNDDDVQKILSFFQTRAIPQWEFLEPEKDGDELLVKKRGATFLETYNCDRVDFPKPSWAWRAKKQIFQPSYVLHHFVHYSLVTHRLFEFPDEPSGLFQDRAPFETRVDEVHDAFLLHAKTTTPAQTNGWKRYCRPDKNQNPKKTEWNPKDGKENDKCPIGIPYPDKTDATAATNADGLSFNCYQHERIHAELGPRLKQLLQPLQEAYRRGNQLEK